MNASEILVGDAWWCNAAVGKCLNNKDDPCCTSFWNSVADACWACHLQCSNRCG